MDFLRNFFLLPPVEQRKAPSSAMRFLMIFQYERDKDEVYIVYLVQRVALTIGFAAVLCVVLFCMLTEPAQLASGYVILIGRFVFWPSYVIIVAFYCAVFFRKSDFRRIKLLKPRPSVDKVSVARSKDMTIFGLLFVLMSMGALWGGYTAGAVCQMSWVEMTPSICLGIVLPVYAWLWSVMTQYGFMSLVTLIWLLLECDTDLDH